MNQTRTFWFVTNVLCAVCMLCSGEWVGILNVCAATLLFAGWLDGVT